MERKTDLDSPVEKLPFVGSAYSQRLKKLEIRSIRDLINHYPFRYDDYSLLSSIDKIQPGEIITLKAKIETIKNEYTRTGKKIQKARVVDPGGEMEIIWFNQPYLIKTLQINEWYQFSGKADWFGRQVAMVSPEFEKIQTTQSIHTGRLVPVYPETGGVSSKWLRSKIKIALKVFGQQIEDFLPEETIKKERLLGEKEAIFSIHFPESSLEANFAKERLAFDELFLLQLSGLIRKEKWESKKTAPNFILDPKDKLKFIESLPFSLTGAQERVIEEILSDLNQKKPMNRLLQGDVGSGKTVVAALAIYTAFLNQFSAVFMAPTEILAQQHFQTLSTIFRFLNLPLELVTSSKKIPSSSSDSPQPKIVVGTHALFYQDLPKKVGLIVIDEQQRFGVEQRAQLLKKSKEGKIPHLLTMTATPIPRTVALTLFGDLDLSYLDEMPKGRQRVKTWVVPLSKREAAYSWIRDKIKNSKEQAFIICPLIEESETLSSVKAATSEFKQLAKNVFPDLKLGLLHGRLNPKEKEKTLDLFRKGKLDILISTPVVEVGIDIPRATIMVIEGADRFGLAQLHQLRGRVGRRELESFCLLFTENQTEAIITRLKFLETNDIGMKLAEIDLKLRGPGEIYGTKQHGFPNLKIASLADLTLIERTRKAAKQVLFQNKSLISNPNSLLNQNLQKYKIQAANLN